MTPPAGLPEIPAARGLPPSRPKLHEDETIQSSPFDHKQTHQPRQRGATGLRASKRSVVMLFTVSVAHTGVQLKVDHKLVST